MALINQRQRIGDLLVELGAVSQSQLAQGLAAQRKGEERLGQTLIRLGFIDRSALHAAPLEQYRRWLGGALGTSMVLNSGSAAAASRRAGLAVSATVVATATMKTEAAAWQPAGHGSSSPVAAVALHCSSGDLAAVSLQQRRIVAPGDGARQGARVRMTDTGPTQVLACGWKLGSVTARVVGPSLARTAPAGTAANRVFAVTFNY